MGGRLPQSVWQYGTLSVTLPAGSGMNRLCLIFVIGLALLCACTSYVRIMDSWVGATEDELVAKWGAPDSVARFDESRVFTYEKFWKDTNKVVNRGRLKFMIDPDGKVVSWQKTNFPDYLFGEQVEDLSRD
jgi:hypothetical protein